ncbi:hypothetical protein PG994_014063 [Apiospora phragmitis]|uniref:Uncharacterized protein n=1 Tax=Apiospora phragmitis TaxID=2905665 RepID=A0ABR1T385_9PEZI
MQDEQLFPFYLSTRTRVVLSVPTRLRQRWRAAGSPSSSAILCHAGHQPPAEVAEESGRSVITKTIRTTAVLRLLLANNSGGVIRGRAAASRITHHILTTVMGVVAAILRATVLARIAAAAALAALRGSAAADRAVFMAGVTRRGAEVMR